MNVVVFSRVAALYQAVLKQCKGVQSVNFQYAAPEDPAAIRSHVQDADVLIADPNDISRLLDQHALSSAKWVHCSFAGVEKVVYHPTAKPTFILTRQAGYFGPQMAEYVLAQIINRERCFFQLHDNQKTSLWSSPQHHDMQYRLLSTLTIGILGAGDIGKKVAALCKSFGMTVWGLTRSPAQGREKCPDIDHYRQLEGLPELLAHSDYICGVLPSTPQTVGLLDGDVLQHCSSKRSVLINVGRGDLVKNATIIKAIKHGWLGGAVLDVFEEEPLPADSELWRMPEVVITPHCSAVSLWDEVAELFAENLKLFLAGKEMKFVVDCEKGY